MGLNLRSYKLGSGGGGSGITAVSIATAHGFSGSSSGGATPIITLSTTVSANQVIVSDGTSLTGNSLFTYNDTTKIFSVGFAANSSSLVLDDSAKTLVYSVGASQHLFIDDANDVYFLGKTKGVLPAQGDGLKMDYVNDIFHLYVNGYGFNYVGSSASITIGSDGATGNNTQFSIDDDNEQFIFSANAVVVIPSVTANSFVTTDGTGTLVAQAFGATDDVVIVGLTNTYTLHFSNGLYTGTTTT